MVNRVMDELRATLPHDDDALLRTLATTTTLGAAAAFHLAWRDTAFAMQPIVERLARNMRRLSGRT